MIQGRLLLLGAGRMGGAMLQGWLRRGLVPDQVSVIDPYPSEWMHELAGQGVRINPDPASEAPADVIVLAVKPQLLDEAAPALAAAATARTLVLSVVAGKTIADLTARAPAARAFVRAMPNTPAAVRRGITACVASAAASGTDRAVATALLEAVGRVEWLDREDLIDAVTAVSGSGPAYVFLLAECLAQAGAEVGLPPDLALRLARATVEGAGELMFQEAATAPEQLRRNVTSPGGTTAAALEVLMSAEGLRPLLTRAVQAAERRARELAG